MRSFRIYLVSVIAMHLVTSANAQALKVGPTDSIADVERTIVQPKTLAALLSNIKIALDHDLLLHLDFFNSDVTLIHFFGGSRVERSKESNPEKIGGALVNFPFDGIRFSFGRLVSGDDRVEGTIALGLRASLSFDEIQKIFGTRWTSSLLPLAPHAPHRPPPTNELGYHQAIFQFGSGRIAFFRLGQNAAVEDALFIAAGRR